MVLFNFMFEIYYSKLPELIHILINGIIKSKRLTMQNTKNLSVMRRKWNGVIKQCLFIGSIMVDYVARGSKSSIYCGKNTT